MAKRGSTKALSVEHEDSTARAYRGVRSPSSGGATSDQGDVRTTHELIECKHRGTYDKPARSASIKLDDLEKIADEAWSELREPVIALRIYCPDSLLADKDGNVDLIVRLRDEDVRRSRSYNYLRAHEGGPF